MHIRQPITTMNLMTLLTRLRDYEEEILRLIDEDALLKRRERADGLIIVNSGPKLFEPVCEHQLFAKGLVYRRDPYKVISIPLIKMFNHGLREHNDATTQKIVKRDDVSLVFPDKLDGTMIHLFAYEGVCTLATRSIVEGLPKDTSFSYVTLARKILEQAHPNLLKPSVIAGLSLVFELIHPKTRQVTKYGAQKNVVLLSIYDQTQWRYWTTQEVFAWGRKYGLECPKIWSKAQDLEAGVLHIREELGNDPNFPEGSILCFEAQGQIVHRIKIKTQEYLKQFARRMSVNYKTVVETLWDRPKLHDWDAYLAYLIDEHMSEEEVEAFYKEYFDEFIHWHTKVTSRRDHVWSFREAFVQEQGKLPENKEAQRNYLKQAAAYGKSHLGEDFSLFMNALRKGDLSLMQVMWHDPPYSSFRALIADRVKG